MTEMDLTWLEIEKYCYPLDMPCPNLIRHNLCLLSLKFKQNIWAKLFSLESLNLISKSGIQPGLENGM